MMWTIEEEEIIRQMKNKRPFEIQKILINRTVCSVLCKKQEMGKKEGWYNEKHVGEKYAINKRFVEAIEPKTVCDAFAGIHPYYNTHFKELSVITNDHIFPANYKMDAKNFLALMIKNNQKFDIVDLDPFGSSAKYVDQALELATKGLIISIGDYVFQRNPRYVVNHCKIYGYTARTCQDLTMDKIIAALQKKAYKLGKTLEVFEKKKWNKFGRVWFIVKPISKEVQLVNNPRLKSEACTEI